MGASEETLLIFRQSATGHLAAVLSTVLCEGHLRLCSPESVRVTDPITIQVLNDVGIEVRELTVLPLDDLEERYHDMIFIAEDGFTASSRIDLPKGRLHEWHLPAAVVRDETYEVCVTRARIVREMIRVRLEQWCARKCRRNYKRSRKNGLTIGTFA